MVLIKDFHEHSKQEPKKQSKTENYSKIKLDRDQKHKKKKNSTD